jgi:hypothetical protein
MLYSRVHATDSAPQVIAHNEFYRGDVWSAISAERAIVNGKTSNYIKAENG